jgi:hypothetical protein
MSDPQPRQPLTLPADSLRSGYESLRQQILLGQDQTGAMGGLVLLMRKGVAAWIAAYRQADSVPRSCSADGALVLSSGLHGDLTKLLAGMALNVANKEPCS